jgi:ubiquinone/menaquinone biosynthesis C-methylase UbiE
MRRPFEEKLGRFATGGLLTFAAKAGLAFILTEIFLLWYFASYIITLASVIIFSFFYNALVTFRAGRSSREFSMYAAVACLFWLADAIAVKYLTELAGLHYMASITAATAAIFAAKFFVYDRVIFTRKAEENIPGNFYPKHTSRNPVVRMLMRKFHSTLFSLIAAASPKSILEVGCGEAYTTELVKGKFPEAKIEASDLEEKIVAAARKRVKGVKFSVEPAERLGRRSGSFDLVALLEVLEHLKQPEAAISEAKRVSRRHCIFSVPNEPWWRLANIARLAYLSRLGNTPGHVNHWSGKGFEKMLRKHFRNVIMRRSGLWNIALCWD